MKKIFAFFVTLTFCTWVYAQTSSFKSPVQNGAWNDPAVWNGGVVPSCSDTVLIANGKTVSVSSTGCVAKSILIDTSGVLSLASGGALTVGCTGNNAFVKNTGTISVGAGTLTINGNLSIENKSKLYQSGGEIVIDGNDNGNIASSVVTGVPLLGFGTPQLTYTTGTIALTGGKIIIVDPHAAADSAFALAYYPSTSNYGIGGVDTGHTIQFGNGVSADPGGSIQGFRNKITNVTDTRRILFGKILVNAGSGLNRIVGPLHVDGDAEIVSGVWRAGNNCIGGNLNVNGGILFADGLVNLCVISVYNSGTLGGREYKFAQTQPVSVSVNNGGQIVNSLTSPTANFRGVALRNSSATGVTFNTLNPIAGALVPSDVSMSGTLTLASKVSMAPGGVFLFLQQDVTNLPTVSGYYTGSGMGFFPGITLARAYTSPLGAQPNFPQNENTPLPADYSIFPFISASGAERTAWIKLTNLVTNGVYAVTYNEVPGTTAVSFIDAASNVITRSNSNWSISTLGTSPAATSPISIAFKAPGIVPGVVAPSFTHVVQANAAVGGYVQGSINPLYGIRNVLSGAEVTSGPFYMGISGTQPVPVTLMYFKGEQRQQKNILRWRTSAESNFSHFELQHSTNGTDFETLAKVAPHTPKGNEYTYADEMPFAGNNFYRLNMVDRDGKSEMSSTVKLLAEQGKDLEIALSPVPVIDKLLASFSGMYTENAQIKIIDMSGKIWRKQKVSHGSTFISVNCQGMPPGVYTFVYSDENNTFRKTFSKK